MDSPPTASEQERSAATGGGDQPASEQLRPLLDQFAQSLLDEAIKGALEAHASGQQAADEAVQAALAAAAGEF